MSTIDQIHEQRDLREDLRNAALRKALMRAVKACWQTGNASGDYCRACGVIDLGQTPIVHLEGCPSFALEPTMPGAKFAKVLEALHAFANASPHSVLAREALEAMGEKP